MRERERERERRECGIRISDGRRTEEVEDRCRNRRFRLEFHRGSSLFQRGCCRVPTPEQIQSVQLVQLTVYTHSHVYLPLTCIACARRDTCVHRARVWLFASQRYHRRCIPVIENELPRDFWLNSRNRSILLPFSRALGRFLSSLISSEYRY